MAVYNKYQKLKAFTFIEETFSKGKCISLSEAKEKRSLDQNKLMWLWLACLESETGNDKETLHEYFKSSFLPIKVDIVFNKEVRRLTSTTELDTKQFTDYLNKIQLFASEQGITLPDPEDKNWEMLYETYKNEI